MTMGKLALYCWTGKFVEKGKSIGGQVGGNDLAVRFDSKKALAQTDVVIAVPSIGK